MTAPLAGAKVLIVMAWDGATGAYTVLRSIAERLTTSSIDVYCFEGFESPSPYSLFAHRLINGKRTHLAWALRSGGYDLVICVDTACSTAFDALKWVAIAAPASASICVSQNSKHEVPPGRRATRWIACSDASKDVLAQSATGPVVVIPNGADTNWFHRTSDHASTPVGPPIIGWVGRTSDLAQKDPIALAILIDRALSAGMVFEIIDVGPQPDWFTLSDWFGSERVTFRHGLQRTEMAEFYRRIAASGGVLVSTSRFEGLSLATLEAVASGCPVIAPDTPGTSELAERGWLQLVNRVPLIDGLWQAIVHMTDPAAHAKAVAATQSIHGSTFTSESMVDSYLREFAGAIEEVRLENVATDQTRRLRADAMTVAAQARLVMRRARARG